MYQGALASSNRPLALSLARRPFAQPCGLGVPGSVRAGGRPGQNRVWRGWSRFSRSHILPVKPGTGRYTQTAKCSLPPPGPGCSRRGAGRTGDAKKSRPDIESGACPGRNQVAGRSGSLTLTAHSAHNKEAMPLLKNIASLCSQVCRFVTDSDIRRHLRSSHAILCCCHSPENVIRNGRQPLARDQKLDCHSHHKKQYFGTRPRQCPSCSRHKQHLCLPESQGSSRN